MSSQPQPTPSLAQLDKRDARALTEMLLAFDDIGWAKGADGLWVVYSADGTEYRIDVETGACDCDDAFYRDPDGGCKHARLVEFLIGEREVPPWVDRSRMHGWLREQLEAGA